MKKMIFILFIAVMASACISAPNSASIQDSEALAAEIDALVMENYLKGVYDGSVLVACNGKVILSRGYGFADREKKILNTPQTKFRIASITKQFTAAAILLLQQRGMLNIDDRICSYITDCPEFFKPVKIRHLLSHSAGIPGATQYSSPGDAMLPKSATLYFTPGEKFVYQDIGYNLAGRIIETVSGQSYASFLGQNIFEPLGMSNTGVDDMKQTDLAKGYASAEGDTPLQPVYGMFAEGSIYSTVEDMYRWDQALYTDKLLPQSLIKAMVSPQIAVPDGKYYGIDGSTGWKYGFGWFIAPRKLGYVIHGGIYPGYRAEFRRYIKDKTVIILLTNQEAVALHETAEGIADTVFK